ncbi:MAG: sodium/proton antiporter [Candidatus Micrarchaeota archaeon]|nr:MAG: sodium/proton antiporter [Candidatus Micrarchaeota archaeon]
MISADIVFITLSASIFFGFILNALLNKLKIIPVIPLIIIGVVFYYLNSAGLSPFIASASNYVSGIAIMAIIFNAGMSLRFERFKRLFIKANLFMIANVIISGLIISFILVYLFRYSYIYALILGFALSGPSSLVVPSTISMIKADNDIKDILKYESVASDIFELILPLTLIQFYLYNGLISLKSILYSYIAYFVFTNIFGSILLGFVFALAWIYLLKRFKRTAQAYAWILTIAFIMLVYSLSDYMNLNSAISVFVTGIVLINVGANRKSLFKSMKADIVDTLKHIYNYQQEFAFLISTIFFIFTGILVSYYYYPISYYSLLVITVSLLIIVLFRYLLARYIQSDKRDQQSRKIVAFDIPRGISPLIIASLLYQYGIAQNNTLVIVVSIIFISSIIYSIGIMIYKPLKRRGKQN